VGKRRRVVQARAREVRKPYVFPWRLYLPIAAILLLTAAVYAQVRNFAFMPVDDPIYVSLNGHVRGGLTPQSIIWALTSRTASNWHPLTWMSHMLDCQFYGLNAGKHHITNLLFHLANTLLLFIVLKRATGAVWRSAFVAGLFALHPLHVESVAWICERKDVLSTFFWMLTMLAYVYYAEKPKAWRYMLVAVAFALGLMAKPMLVSIPIVLLLFDYWPLKRGDVGWKRLVLEKTPLFVLSLASCVMTFIAQHGGGAMQEFSAYPLGVRIANSLVAYTGYLAKMIVPTNIGPMYPHPGNTIPVWTVVISGLVFAALTVTALALGRKVPYLIVGWLIYVITLGPVIGLVQVGQQSMADRYTYIPLIGIFIAIAWMVPAALGGLVRRDHGITLGIVGGLIIALLSVMTQHQVGTWKNDDSFIRQMLRATYNHPLSRALEAKLINQEGRPVDAEAKMAALVRDCPRLPEARVGHGCMLGMMGRYDEAAAELKQAIKLRPNYPEAYSNLGVLYENARNPEEGIKWCRKAVEMAPDVGQWHANLARVLATLKRWDESASEYKRALRIRPDIPDAERDLGVVLYQNQDTTSGIEHLEIAVQNSPNDAMGQYILGTMLQRTGQNNEAIDHLSAAVHLRPTWADAHGMLSMALNGAGLNQQAREELKLAEKYGAPVATPPAKP